MLRNAIIFVAVCATSIAWSAEAPVDFVRDVAPIFETRCMRCHQASEKKGEISFSTRSEMLESGSIEPGKPDESRLLEVVVTADGEDRPQMPKTGAVLTEKEVETLRRWIADGAKWPEGASLTDKTRADKTWWSLQPLSGVAPPDPQGLPEDWSANGIDRFIFAKLKESNLAPNPPAERRTLIRRVTYDLTGLPPTPEDVAAFVADDSPDAYEKLVDRLLSSPRYGEQWGRHWLDIARFGESNGFERNVIISNAWPYRDYVIQSLNDDKPFDQFIREQIAGDVIAPGEPSKEAGTAFLVCGPFDNVTNQDAAQRAIIRADELDEIIRATSEAFLGMTVGCARCHNHKFDPITQRDYYSLYATFAGVRHADRKIESPEAEKVRLTLLKPQEEKKKSLVDARAELQKRLEEEAENRAGEFEKTWTRPAVSRYGTEDRFDPVPAKFVRLKVLARDDKPQYYTDWLIDEFEIWTAGKDSRNVALAKNGAKAIGESVTVKDFAATYGVAAVNDGKFGERWIAKGDTLTIELPKVETIDRILFSSDRLKGLVEDSFVTVFLSEYTIEVSSDGESWKEVATSANRQPMSKDSRMWRLVELTISQGDRAKRDSLDRSITAIEKEIANLPPAPVWFAGVFANAPGPFHIFTGGDPAKKADEVCAASPSFLESAAPAYELDPKGSEKERRRKLAEWISADQNPLTPRVLANRLWHYHFGVGIVDTPSDFGFMGGRPSHPELLDWLAGQVHEHGWRLKPLHKLIVMSQTYRQSSVARQEALRTDADSRLLWRFPPRRLSGEELRDGMLLTAGVLNTKMGGPGFRLYQYLEDNVATYVPLAKHGPETYRRAVYHQNARAARVDLLSDFDCPDPVSPAPRRTSTTTPLQALTLFNHSFTQDMAEQLAAKIESEKTAAEDRVIAAFERMLYRQPNEVELKAGMKLVDEHGLAALCRALFNANEFLYLN